MAALLFLGLVVVYFCNFRMRGAGDSFPTRVLPFSILREGNVDLNEFTWAKTEERAWPYYIHGMKTGKSRTYYSVSPIATSFVVTPLYVLPAAWLAWADVPYVDSRARVLMVVMEKLSAAVLTALSAVVLFLVLSRLTTQRAALALTLVYALGTCTWAISSQALWQHGLAELCLGLLFLGLARERMSWVALAGIGVVCAVMIANRPQMSIFAVAVVAYLISLRPLLAIPIALAGCAFGAALIGSNYLTMGNAYGGYGRFDHFSVPFLEGFLGLTVSPNRGLLIYTPIALFSAWGFVQVVRGQGPHWLRFFAVALCAHVVMYSKFDDWHAGFTYGPRYFTDVLPLLTLFLVYGLLPYWNMSLVRGMAVCLVAYGVIVQAIGVYAADDSWNLEPISVDTKRERVWDWDDTQIGRSIGNGFKGFEILPTMIDVFTDTVPARLAQLKPEDLASRLTAVGLPATMRPGERRTIAVEATNLGSAAWPMFSGKKMLDIRHLVFLVQSWIVGNQQLQGYGEVVLIPENIEPGETVRIEMPLVAPDRPGVYDIQFRVSQAIDGLRGVASPDRMVHRLTVR